jgi:hypothetical protein
MLASCSIVKPKFAAVSGEFAISFISLAPKASQLAWQRGQKLPDPRFQIALWLG